MTNSDVREYEALVREAQRMADNSLNESDKASWLRIAQQWLRMLRTHRKGETPQEDQSGWPAPSDERFPSVALIDCPAYDEPARHHRSAS